MLIYTGFVVVQLPAEFLLRVLSFSPPSSLDRTGMPTRWFAGTVYFAALGDPSSIEALAHQVCERERVGLMRLVRLATTVSR